MPDGWGGIGWQGQECLMAVAGGGGQEGGGVGGPDGRGSGAGG